MHFRTVFRKETLNESRRIRSYWLRVGYVIVVFGMVVLVFQGQLEGKVSNVRKVADTLSKLGGELYRFISITQIVLAMLITPILVTGAFVAEKRTGTLALLSMTHLTDREIIVGKVLAKYLFMAMLILSALPLLGMITVFGTIEPRMVIGNTINAFSAMLVAGAMAALYGLTARSIASAVGWTYLMLLLLYGVLTNVVALISQLFVGEQVHRWIWYALNPIAGQMLLIEDATAGTTVKFESAEIGVMIVMQLVVAALVSWRFLTKAEAQYRWWSLGLSPQAFDWSRTSQARPAKTTSRGSAATPSEDQGVGAFAMRAGSTRGLGRLARLRTITLGLAIAFEAIAALLSTTGLAVHRIFLVGQFLALAVVLAIHSGSVIAQEKEDRTLGVLLTTPMTSLEILWGKVQGIVRLMFVPMLIMTGHVLAFTAFGLLSPRALLIPVVAVLYLSLVIAAGLAISALQATAAKAVAWSMSLLIGITLGSLMIGELLQTSKVGAPIGRAISFLNPVRLILDALAPGTNAPRGFADAADIAVRIDPTTGAQMSTTVYWFISFGVVTTLLVATTTLLLRRFPVWVRQHV